MTNSHVLSATAFARLSDELERLISTIRPDLSRLIVSQDGIGDAADQAASVDRVMELERVDARIAQLRDLLAEARVVEGNQYEPGNVVQLGMTVTLRFAGATETERYLVGDIEEQVGSDISVVTPASPLGCALLGATIDSTVVYQAPSGPQKVHVLAVDRINPDAHAA